MTGPHLPADSPVDDDTPPPSTPKPTPKAPPPPLMGRAPRPGAVRIRKSAHGDRRAFLVWDRLILPNGKSLILSEEPGVDAQGAIGVRGEVDRRLLPLGVATLFAGAITTLGELARGGSEDRSFAASAGSAASIEAAQVGGRLVDRELGVQPSIRVRAGAPVRVMITRDLILEPYRR